MVPFKPAEIRIVVILAVLALIGSAVALVNRQGNSSRLDLGIFSERTPYKYNYGANAAVRLGDTSSISQLTRMAAIPEAEPDDYKIDINHCGIFDIEKLPGIGPVIAGKIIAYRDSVGGFKSIDDINNVNGIGPAKFAMIKDRIELK